MSLLASIALAAASGASLPACSWDRPGVDPFMGDVVAAVDRYKDIPAAVRVRLKERMQKRRYDEIVSIRRESIDGEASYGSEIRDMHFGTGKVCATVTRSRWTDQMHERGLVYCEDSHCVLVPTVCRNVSRIERLARPAPKPTAVVATRELADDPQGQLDFDPPAAGVLGGGSPTSFESQIGGRGLDGSTVVPGGVMPGPRPAFGGGNPGPSFGGIATPPLPPGTVPTGRFDPIPQPSPNTPAIPEPDTWALLLAGLAAVLFVALRRR
jgi:hypothetical protein